MTRTYGWMTAALLSMTLAGLAGCKPSDAIRHGAVLGKGSKPASEALDPATLGAVSGTVRFYGKPPARVKIDMSQDPGCTKSAEDNYSEQIVVHEGQLANVYVYVKSGPPAALAAPPTSAQPVVMNQLGCRYVPHVVALMKGGSVEFRNSDPTPHNIHTLPAGEGKRINVTQAPRGATDVVQFTQPEVMLPVRCDLHPWMNSFINVSETPFFAVTDAVGHFEIEGLPAGTYVLGAVHEKMGEQTLTVTVKPHETGKADFVFALN
jgi:plastocyanin